MGRKPDSNAKIPQIVIRAVNKNEAIKINAAKEIIARNSELTITTTKTRKGEGIKWIEKFLGSHNWPPGNSQTVLPAFGVDGKKICQFPGCGKQVDHVYDCLFISGLRCWCCKDCKEEAEERTTLDKCLGMR